MFTAFALTHSIRSGGAGGAAKDSRHHCHFIQAQHQTTLFKLGNTCWNNIYNQSSFLYTRGTAGWNGILRCTGSMFIPTQYLFGFRIFLPPKIPLYGCPNNAVFTNHRVSCFDMGFVIQTYEAGTRPAVSVFNFTLFTQQC